MSILDLYSKGTSTGTAPEPGSGLPTAQQTIDKLGFNSSLDADSAGKYKYTDTVSKIQEAGTDTDADPLVAHALAHHAFTPVKYLNGAFDTRRPSTLKPDSSLNADDAGKYKYDNQAAASQIIADYLANRSVRPTKYVTTNTDKINKAKNRLVSFATGTNSSTKSMLGPGYFPTDVIPYTERAFSQQAINSGQTIVAPTAYSVYQATTLAVAPSATQAASTTVPILTPTQPSTISTISGMGSVVDDGRYNITVGYGFILYAQGTYGS